MQLLDGHSLGQLTRIPHLDPVVVDGQRHAAIEGSVVAVDQGIHERLANGRPGVDRQIVPDQLAGAELGRDGDICLEKGIELLEENEEVPFEDLAVGERDAGRVAK